jgi:acyl-CoA thioester hydrolase
MMSSSIEGSVRVPHDGRSIYEMHLRVRHYETDVLGHVNNVVYLQYFQQAAAEHCEALGFDAARLAALGGYFVVRRHEVEYLGSAVAGDDLVITTWSESLAGVRAVRCYEARHARSGLRLVAARTLWVWLDRATGRPRILPPEIHAAFGASDTGHGK